MMKKVILLIMSFAIYSFASAQLVPQKREEMKGMDMKKKDEKKQLGATTYTFVIHPEIHAAHPGNCSKCGMALIKEKAKPAVKPVVKKSAEMKMPMDSTKPVSMDMGKLKMDSMKRDHHNDVKPMMEEKKTVIKTIRNNEPPKVVRYDLYIKDTIVDFTGKLKRAIAVNGMIPMPTLTFTEGDTAEIYVYNMMDE